MGWNTNTSCHFDETDNHASSSAQKVIVGQIRWTPLKFGSISLHIQGIPLLKMGEHLTIDFPLQNILFRWRLLYGWGNPVIPQGGHVASETLKKLI